MKVLKKYIFNLLIAADVFFNALFGGSPKMTISTRVYLYKEENLIARGVYTFLNWLDKDHCEEALEYDLKPADNNDSVLK